MAFESDNNSDSEDVGRGIDRFIHDLSNPGIAQIAILALAIINSLIWALAIIYPTRLLAFLSPFSSVEGEFQPLPALIPFVIGAALAFSIVRYVRPTAGGYQSGPPNESGIMGIYSETESRQKIWFIAAGAGVANLLGLLLVSSGLT